LLLVLVLVLVPSHDRAPHEAGCGKGPEQRHGLAVLVVVTIVRMLGRHMKVHGVMALHGRGSPSRGSGQRPLRSKDLLVLHKGVQLQPRLEACNEGCAARHRAAAAAAELLAAGGGVTLAEVEAEMGHSEEKNEA
jgi:hypothetical protein